MTNLLQHVEQSIQRRKLFCRAPRIMVAVSGGLDSVVLLHLLHALAAKHGWKLTVAHLNHQLRGGDSNRDEQFVRALASRLHLPCVTQRTDVRQQAKKLGVSIEMAARRARHEFLTSAAKEARLSSIAVAHHADDQVELFFLRLFRGTGSEGLAGMKWRGSSPVNSSIQLVRPLLDVSRADLEQFARGNKTRFRKDTSNASRDILRNRVRHELLPLLRRRFQPAVKRSVLRLMEIAAAESDVLAGLTQAALKSRKRPFGSLPVAVQRRVLQAQLQQRNVKPDFDLVERLRAVPGQPVNISPHVSAFRDATGQVKLRVQEHVSFNSNEMLVALRDVAGRGAFGGIRFWWRYAAGGSFTPPKRRIRRECFDAGLVGDKIILRHWRAADRFQPIGLPSPVKLQDWFTNQKVPRIQRRQLIVATTLTGEIFWIEGQRIAERFKLTRGTKRRLIWRWQRV